MTHTTRIGLGLMIVWISVTPVLSNAAETGWDCVNRIRTGGVSGDENFRVVLLDYTPADPESCDSATTYDDEFVMTPMVPQYKMNSSILLAAFQAGDEVKIIYDGCEVGRKRIVGIQFRNSTRTTNKCPNQP